MQVNSRKIYDEPNVLDGILSNQLFLLILGAEAALQVLWPCLTKPLQAATRCWECQRHCSQLGRIPYPPWLVYRRLMCSLEGGMPVCSRCPLTQVSLSGQSTSVCHALTA